MGETLHLTTLINYEDGTDKEINFGEVHSTASLATFIDDIINVSPKATSFVFTIAKGPQRTV